MKKCKGGCQMRAGGKTCMKCGCDMEDEEYEKGEKEEKEMRSGGMACMKCGGKMHKSGGTVSSCMKCGGGKYTFGGKVGWSKKKLTREYASGGMIKRADGSYSQRGLWDNIRDNAGSGKKPTKQMLEQEKKIKQKMAVGGKVDTGCPPGFVRVGEDCVPAATAQDSTDVMNKAIELSNFYKNTGYKINRSEPYNVYRDFAGELNRYNEQFQKYKNETRLLKNSYDSDIVEEVQSPVTNQTYRKNPNPNKLNIIEQREKTYGALNISAPYGYYDTRIKPQFHIHYSLPSDNINTDYAEVPMYDPLAVKPYKTRTPQEHIIYQQKYGNYGGAKTPYNPYAPVRVPITEYTQQDLDKAIKRRREQEDLEAWNKWIAENPLPEPEPRMNDEMEISYYKPVDMPMIKSGLIPTNDPLKRKVYAGPGANTGRVKPIIPMPNQMWERGPGEERSLEEQYATDKEVIVNPEEFIKNRTSSQKKLGKSKRKFSFGGAVSSMKQYIGGGEVARTGNRNADIALTLMDMFKYMKESKDKSKYTGKTAGGYDYYIDEEGFPVVNIPDSEIPYDEEGKYDDQLMVKSAKVANTLGSEKQSKGSNTQLDYSLPNWGYAKMEQKKLNELIQAEIKAGAKDLELLVEDDIIGEKTLSAMNKFEGKGYTRPEGFKDKWLKKYAEDYARGVRMQVPGVTAPVTPKVPGKESVKTTEIKAEEDQTYTSEDFYEDLFNAGKGALEYFFPKIKTTPVKTTTKEKQPVKEKQKTETVKPKEESSYFPSLSDMVSGLKSGISSAIGYTGDALNYTIEESGKFLEKAKAYEKAQNEKSARNNFGKRTAKESAANAESKKEVEYLKSNLTSGYNAVKQLGSDAMTGIGNAFEYVTNLAKIGEELKQQESAKNNFGKRSAKAAAEAAERNAKKPSFSESYVPSIFPVSQPIVITSNKENLPIITQKSQTPETFTSIKDFLFANKAEDKKKTVAEAMAKNEYKKRINEEAKTIMKLNLKTPTTKEDIKYNYSAIDENIKNIEKALVMLSGPTTTTDRGFNDMTTKMVKKSGTTVGQKYKNIPTTAEYESIQTVNEEEYDKLVVIKTFLDKELDKIHRDPKYKNLDATDKKAVLTRALFNKRKELGNKQYFMKNQLK